MLNLKRIYYFTNSHGTYYCFKTSSQLTNQTSPSPEFYERVTALRSKGVKVSIAIGGWTDSKGGKYSEMVREGLKPVRNNKIMIFPC